MGHSLKDVFYLFMLLFMFLSPLIQYVTDNFPWWDTHLIVDRAILHANFTIFIFLITYQVSYSMKSRTSRNTGYQRNIKNVNIVIDSLFVASFIASIFVISIVGFQNLFSRSTYVINTNSRSAGLIIANTLRAIPVIYVAINLVFIKKYKYIYKKIPLILGITLMILINFPTATARFWMASIYLGLFIILLGKSKNPHFLKFTLLLGMLVVFPVINIFRRNSFQEVLLLGIDIPRVTELLTYGDFDSYSMLVRGIIYTSVNGISWGRQLLGNVLFFVPRTVWPNKPIGSGLMIASDLGWQFTNVSFPYIGEGYINFGILGVILFAVVLGRISKKADHRYKFSIENTKVEINYVDIVYPFTLGFLFFIMRGDLLSSLSFYIGFMLPVIVLFILQKLRFSIK
ncbi:O-antigen polymerase [Fundicoccus sp. Sow4_F4]|uniref:O-antigen polymerase n=1 Tax=Fundicoccus sp. Sow4_F4 TaxID=3438783 RepID=UPI003F8EB0FC